MYVFSAEGYPFETDSSNLEALAAKLLTLARDIQRALSSGEDGMRDGMRE